MSALTKNYVGQAFILEETKLRKIIDVMHHSFDDEEMTKDQFCVFFKNKQTDEFSDLEHVLSLDNSRKSPIERLVMSTYHKIADDFKSVQIDFGSEIRIDSSKTAKGVTISVEGRSHSWKANVVGSLEEQLERTWVSYYRQVVSAVLVTVFVFILTWLALGFGLKQDNWINLSSGLWLTTHQVHEIALSLNKTGQLTPQQSLKVQSEQIMNLESYYNQATRPFTVSDFLLTLPFILTFAAVLYMLLFLYPSRVFLWGDEIAKNAERISQRKWLWGTVYALTFGAVVAALFLTGPLSLVLRHLHQ